MSKDVKRTTLSALELMSRASEMTRLNWLNFASTCIEEGHLDNLLHAAEEITVIINRELADISEKRYQMNRALATHLIQVTTLPRIKSEPPPELTSEEEAAQRAAEIAEAQKEKKKEDEEDE